VRLFSEEEQATSRWPWLRSEKGRRIAVFIALPLGAYAVLAVVGLLGGPRLPLIPLPGSGGAEVISPVAGPPSSRSTDRVYPPIPAETPLPSTPLPTSTPTTDPTGNPSAPVTTGSADRPTQADDRRTTVSSTPVPADERTVPPTAQPTRVPPKTQPTTPTTTTSVQSPTIPWTPSPTPTQPTGDPDHRDPTLGDVLRALLGGLTP